MHTKNRAREQAVAAAVARHPSALQKSPQRQAEVVWRQLGLPGFGDGPVCSAPRLSPEVAYVRRAKAILHTAGRN